jgi:hypothetical protein
LAFLESSQYAAFDSPGDGGLLDPVIGVRYTTTSGDDRWRESFESAIKIPLAKRNAALSTGRTDYRAQLSGGIHHRRGAHLFTFALTENTGNINNTPDIGWQVGYSFNPGWN